MSSGAVDSQDPDSIPPASRRGRSAAEIPVDLHGVDGPFPGITRNISREGAFIATHRPLPPGTRFLLFLVVAGNWWWTIRLPIDRDLGSAMDMISALLLIVVGLLSLWSGRRRADIAAGS